MPQQFQIPDFEGETRQRAVDRQNAMAMKSNLVTQGLMQNRMGMQNQDMAKEMQDRQELEALLTSTPPEQRERAGLEFLRQRDPDKAAKLEAHYLDRFGKRVAIDDKGAVDELERATGERIQIGERYVKMKTDSGEVYFDKIKGTWHQVEDAKGLAILQSDRRIKEEQEKLTNQKALETHKAGLPQKPGNASDIEGYVENRAQQHKLSTGRDATPGQRADWQQQFMLQLAQSRIPPAPSQFVGNQEGQPLAYIPGRGGPGRMDPIPGASPTSITPRTAQPLSDKTQQTISGGIHSLNILNQLETLVPTTNSNTPILNKVSGAAKQLGVKAGFSGPSQQFEDLVQTLKIEAQSIIKGTPSNFDVQTFIAGLPALDMSKTQALNKITIAKQKLSEEIKNQIAYYKGSNRIIPTEILDSAKAVGVDVDSVQGSPNPWGGGTGGQNRRSTDKAGPKILSIQRIE